jgi:hypothetical protein
MSRCNTEFKNSGEACTPFLLLAYFQSEYEYRAVTATKVVAKCLCHVSGALGEFFDIPNPDV